MKLYSIDFIASKKIVLSIYRLKKDLRNNKLDFIERERCFRTRYVYVYVREKILKLYSIDFITSKIVLSIYRLKKDLRNNKLDFIEREKKYTKTIIMLDANIRSLLSVSAHVESSLPSRTFIPVSILINFSCLLADLRSTTSHVLRHRVMEKR